MPSLWGDIGGGSGWGSAWYIVYTRYKGFAFFEREIQKNGWLNYKSQILRCELYLFGGISVSVSSFEFRFQFRFRFVFVLLLTFDHFLYHFVFLGILIMILMAVWRLLAVVFFCYYYYWYYSITNVKKIQHKLNGSAKKKTNKLWGTHFAFWFTKNATKVFVLFLFSKMFGFLGFYGSYTCYWDAAHLALYF